MNRHELSNKQWERLQPLLPPQKPKTGRPAADHHRLLNGILWLLRTGACLSRKPEPVVTLDIAYSYTHPCLTPLRCSWYSVSVRSSTMPPVLSALLAFML